MVGWSARNRRNAERNAAFQEWKEQATDVQLFELEMGHQRELRQFNVAAILAGGLLLVAGAILAVFQ